MTNVIGKVGIAAAGVGTGALVASQLMRGKEQAHGDKPPVPAAPPIAPPAPREAGGPEGNARFALNRVSYPSDYGYGYGASYDALLGAVRSESPLSWNSSHEHQVASAAYTVGASTSRTRDIVDTVAWEAPYSWSSSDEARLAVAALYGYRSPSETAAIINDADWTFSNDDRAVAYAEARLLGGGGDYYPTYPDYDYGYDPYVPGYGYDPYVPGYGYDPYYPSTPGYGNGGTSRGDDYPSTPGYPGTGGGYNNGGGTSRGDDYPVV